MIVLQHKGSDGKRTAVPKGLASPDQIAENTNLEFIDWYGSGLNNQGGNFSSAERVGLRMVWAPVETIRRLLRRGVCRRARGRGVAGAAPGAARLRDSAC